MSWSEATLSDLAFFQRGFDITKKEQRPGPYPVVSSSGVKSHHADYKVRGPGVVIGRKGTLGTVHYIESDFWPHDTSLWVKDFRGNLPRFVYYFVKTMAFERFDVGGANPTLNRNHIHGLPIRLPSTLVQRRIADILSAYDDLVENNTRRMALLEESIHLLFREWFVYLRFPGHERVEVVDGVPDGWGRKTLRDLVTLNYGKGLVKKTRVPGPVPVYGSSGVVGTHNNPLVGANGIIVGRKGNVGSVFWSAVPFFPIDTVFFIAPNESSLFMYALLCGQTFVSSDAAVPGLNREYAYSKKVMAPPSALVAEFNELAATSWAQRENLASQIEKLREARDLLLPRLMDGRISV